MMTIYILHIIFSRNIQLSVISMIYSITFYLTTSYKLVHSDSVISMLIIVNIFDRGSGANAVGFCKHKKIILRKNVLLY